MRFGMSDRERAFLANACCPFALNNFMHELTVAELPSLRFCPLREPHDLGKTCLIVLFFYRVAHWYILHDNASRSVPDRKTNIVSWLSNVSLIISENREQRQEIADLQPRAF